MGNYKFYKAKVDLAMESCKAVNDTWNNVRRRDKDRKDVDENSSTALDSLSSLALGTVNIGDIYKDSSKSSDMVTQRLNEIEVSAPEIDLSKAMILTMHRTSKSN
ncbi:hypothetical protein BFJ65_g14283 [Fusarium oxysporum f. sp. cepae]|uniref:Uncharacterized protein n=1 Tax=Fusarium oxysporum f. sp. cepae TaxID=396571 RepID=A0A3L6N647_FUSOX|nr:hypothetical protein BFJ65_g14283 [Fusarium oxysporum f. sp. cepae]